MGVKTKIENKSKNATIIDYKEETGTKGWLEKEGIEVKSGKVTLYKRVSKDLKTQENTQNETVWTIGSTLTHAAWEPKKEECGAGKYHACSRPYFCDEFRSEMGDKYIAIEVAVKDLYAWPNGSYPHKIAFRSGKVLMEVDKWGEKV